MKYPEPKTFKCYPNSNLMENPKNWDKLIKLSEQEVIELEKTWKEIQEHNKNAKKENTNVYNQTLSDISINLTGNGIEIWKNKNTFVPVPWFKKFIEIPLHLKYNRYAPEYPYPDMAYSGRLIIINNMEIYIHYSSSIGLLELYKTIISKCENAIETKKERDDEKANIFKKIMEIAISRNIDISDCPDTESIIKKVDTILKKEYADKQIAEHTIISFDGCDECGEYEINNHRCICGNRRVDWSIEGNVIDGYFILAEAY